MAQVDSENSTAMPVVSTRRHFLSQAAGAAAGGAVLALAAIPPAFAAAAPVTTPDAVYGLIEAHRAASAAHAAVLKEQAHREDVDTELNVTPTWARSTF
jgi:hypothetical protein